jgi:predicted RNA-binding protein
MNNKKTNSSRNRYFILIGSPENWHTSLNQNVWGFTENSKGSWNTIKEGDFLAFYVTSPIKKVVGFGHIGKKFINNNLIWNDEKLFKRTLWKYKVEIKPTYVCENWNDGIDLPPIVLRVSRREIDENTFSDLIKKADLSWGSHISKEFGKEIKN